MWQVMINTIKEKIQSQVGRAGSARVGWGWGMKCCSTGVGGRVGGVTKTSLRTFQQIPEGKWEVSHRGA